jgi:hypothetical protein
MASMLDAAARAVPQLLLVFGMGAAAIPVSVWLVFWGRGSIEHLTWVLVPAVLLAPVLLIASAGVWLWGRRTPHERARRRLHWASALGLGVGPDRAAAPRSGLVPAVALFTRQKW